MRFLVDGWFTTFAANLKCNSTMHYLIGSGYKLETICSLLFDNFVSCQAQKEVAELQCQLEVGL